MRLIVNADDLGFSKGINYGIYDAYQYGIVRSTTLMMNMAQTDHAIELLGSTGIGIGVHLNITSGRPLLDTHQCIVDEEGFFISKHSFEGQALEEIKEEFEAQILKALDKGIDISHLDSHHHIHMWAVSIFEMTAGLARKYKVKIRCNKNYEHLNDEITQSVETTMCFSEDFFDKTVNSDNFLEIINRHKDCDSLEIMVHPGFLCGQLINRDSYREMRMVENSILTSTIVKDFIQNNDIELINYHQLG